MESNGKSIASDGSSVKYTTGEFYPRTKYATQMAIILPL